MTDSVPLIPRDLYDELCEACQNSDLLIFAGAGVSRASGLPISSQIIEQSIKALRRFSRLPNEYQEMAQDVCPKQLRLEVFLRELIDVLGEKKGLLPLTLLRGGEPALTHSFAAELFARGWLKHVVTTNFDLLFEQACKDRSVPIAKVVSEDSYKTWLETKKGQAIFKLHGSLPETTECDLLNIQAEVRQVAQGLGELKMGVLEQLLKSHVFLFLGYSGRDFFGAMPVVFRSNFKRVVWVEHTTTGKASDGNRVVKQWLEAKTQGTYIETDTAEFLGHLSDRLGLELLGKTPPQKVETQDPFIGESSLLELAADVIIAGLLKHVGKSDAAYRCYADTARNLQMPEHSNLIAKCCLECSALALAGIEGWMLEFSAVDFADSALVAASEYAQRSGYPGQVLMNAALLAKLEADWTLRIPTAGMSREDVWSFILSTQSIIDWAMANGEAVIVAKGCRLIAEIFLNHVDIRMAINMYVDTVLWQRAIYAQDLLASSYYWLAYMSNAVGELETELEYNVERLKSLLLLRQTPEHEHIASCLRMIKRTLETLGRNSEAGKKAVVDVDSLGFSI